MALNPKWADTPFRILVVDDNEAIHHDFRKIFERINPTATTKLSSLEKDLFGNSLRAEQPLRTFLVDCAVYGQEARDMVRQSMHDQAPYAMAFVDVRMESGWDGIETTLHLWREDPDLPVVLCTAYADYSWDDMVSSLGASDQWLILKKPFDMIEVRQVAAFLTHRRVFDSALVRSLEQYQLLAGHIEDVIWAMDDHFTVTYISPSIETLTGYSADEITGGAFEQILSPASREGAVKKLRDQAEAPPDARTGRKVVVMELEVLRKDGSRSWVEAKITPIYDAVGRMTYAVGAARDVSTRRRLEERLAQVQKMEAVGRLAGGIAHDFNNLLTAIIGRCELVMQSLPKTSPLESDLDEVRKAAMQAATLTHQLLAFGRRQVLRPRTMSVNEAVTEIERMVRRVLGEKIDLTLNLDPEVCPIYADASQLGNVIMNLVVNARDAMVEGGMLTISTHTVTLESEQLVGADPMPAGEYAVIEVADNGVGMDEQMMACIFEPFFTTKDLSYGAGLGLSMVYGTVRQSGGAIGVQSAPGQGATFRLYFPRAQSVPFAGTLETKKPAATDGKTVLVVEDELAVRQLVCRILSQDGFHVLEAANGVDALDVASRHEGKIDLMVTDAIMPHMSGNELIQRISAARPDLAIMIISGYVQETPALQSASTASIPFLQKPFSSHDLLGMVRRLVH